MNENKNNNERGAILIIVLFILILISMLMISLALLHRHDLEIVSSQVQDLTAFYCAEVGIERTIMEARKIGGGKYPSWPAGNPFSGTITEWKTPGEDDEWRPCSTNTELVNNYNANYPAFQNPMYRVQVTEAYADPNDLQCYHYLWVTSTGKTGDGAYTRSIRALLRRAKRTQNNLMGDLTNYYIQVLQYEGL